MITPKKSLGQNFLIDKNIVKKISLLTRIKNENILEVGPGYGILTDEIIKLKPNKLILIEKDDEITKLLKTKYSDKKIKIINSDILEYNFHDLKNFKIISNLPYNISSKFIIKALKLNQNITEIVCMVQSELANKFDYRNGKMNKYKFISQFYSTFESKFKVSKNVFYPKPKVQSKVIKFILNKKNIDDAKFDYFVRYFFTNKRKKIKANKELINYIDKKYLNLRFEDLEYEQILKIYHTFQFFSS